MPSPTVTTCGSVDTEDTVPEGSVGTAEGRGENIVSWGCAPTNKPDVGVGSGTVGSSSASVGTAAGGWWLVLVEREAVGMAGGRVVDVLPGVGVAVTIELAADVEESAVFALTGCGDGVSANCIA